MQNLGTESRPLRVAIVGAGPSGFYAAEALFKSGLSVIVDAFDRLPTPYGLLRGGVAPDHQQLKTLGKYYERIALQNTHFSFFGNVSIGIDLSVADLKNHYDAVIFATGAETDRKLGIPGEDLPLSRTATEFVGWYNGHPDYQNRHFDLSQKSVAVIGQGNVAIDVTRILAKTVEELRKSDITQHALDALAKSQVREIHLIGRRGPVQSAFTELEIKELGHLSDCGVVVDPSDMIFDDESRAELETNSKAKKNVAVLEEFSKRAPHGKSKTIRIWFYRSPVEIKPGQLILEKNRLENQQAVGTGEKQTIDCGLIFRSVGYRGLRVPGIPFDEKTATLPNREGRVLNGAGVLPGFYAVGWIKRGAKGVLGTNKADSAATVASLISDLATLAPCPDPDREKWLSRLKNQGIRPVSFSDWKKIDEKEIRLGAAKEKPREKFTTRRDLLSAIDD